jgi:hypothetical protein
VDFFNKLIARIKFFLAGVVENVLESGNVVTKTATESANIAEVLQAVLKLQIHFQVLKMI